MKTTMQGIAKPGLIALALCAGTLAQAETRNCAPREGVIARLAEKYGETRKSIALGQDNAVIEVFASAETGTWTITHTARHGLACIVATGRSFSTMARMLPPQGDAV